MKFGLLAWAMLILFSIIGLYLFLMIVFLSSLMFALVYTFSLLLLKKYYKNQVEYFFILLCIVLIGISLYDFTVNERVSASYFLGMLVSIIVLVPFKALPFIETWTRKKALLRFRDLGFHHWLFGSLITLVFTFALPLIESIPGFSWATLKHEEIAFFIGFGFFWAISQAPEIVLTKSAFPVEFKKDC